MPKQTRLEKCKQAIAAVEYQRCAACNGTAYFNFGKHYGETFWACNKADCQDTIRTAIKRVQGA